MSCFIKRQKLSFSIQGSRLLFFKNEQNPPDDFEKLAKLYFKNSKRISLKALVKGGFYLFDKTRFSVDSNDCALMFQNSITELQELTSKYQLSKKTYNFIPRSFILDEPIVCLRFVKLSFEKKRNYVIKIGENSHQGQ